MADYTCPHCGFVGEPADVETTVIVDAVGLTCADCGTSTLRPVAFAKARREKHRMEVEQ